MFMAKYIWRGALLAATILAGCSSLRNDNGEKEVRTFLSQFESSWSKSDDEALAFFRVRQSREAVLDVIAILRNQDAHITCEPAIQNAVITPDKDFITVAIPVRFKTKDLSEEDAMDIDLILKLEPLGDAFIITELEGETFYMAFQQMKNRNEWQAQSQQELIERAWIYEHARNLESTFDSLIWYAIYDNKPYFYAVTGTWAIDNIDYGTGRLVKNTAAMGLITAEGDTIIPMEYDLIGTLGFEIENQVEVWQNGYVGIFDISEKKLLLPTEYDMIVPYVEGDKVLYLVRKDNAFGWVDAELQFHEGFASDDMKSWVTGFEFLKQSIRLDGSSYAFHEIPSEEQAGNGLVVTPSYLSYYEIFDPIESGICTTDIPINAWTEYKEKDASFMEKIAANLNMLVTTVQSRYLEGREDFYAESTLTFVNDDAETLGVSSIPGGESVSMHVVDSTLLEVQTPHDYWFMENNACDESNLTNYRYFAIGNDGVTELSSRRLFAQTEYVKLDSSYLSGSFQVYDANTQREETTSFLSARTIQYMRDEILAEYGYQNPAAEEDPFAYIRPEGVVINDLETVMEKLSETDRHNVEFLSRMLEYLNASA
jgi:hypothetical protein